MNENKMTAMKEVETRAQAALDEASEYTHAGVLTRKEAAERVANAIFEAANDLGFCTATLECMRPLLECIQLVNRTLIFDLYADFLMVATETAVDVVKGDR